MRMNLPCQEKNKLMWARLSTDPIPQQVRKCQGSSAGRRDSEKTQNFIVLLAHNNQHLGWNTLLPRPPKPMQEISFISRNN